MTIVDRNAPEPTPQGGMSPKTKQAVAVGVLLACLLIGGGIVYLLLFSSPKGKRSVQVDPAAQAPARPQMAGRMAQRRDVPGAWKQDDEWVIRSATGEMRVKTGAAGAADANFRFPEGLKLAPEQVSLIAGRFRILNDEAMAAEWKVTPDQIARLKSAPISTALMTPSQAQREELWKLYQSWDKATGQAKVDEQKKLTDKLEETAKSLFEPARKQIATQLDGVQKVLTAEQVQLITKR